MSELTAKEILEALDRSGKLTRAVEDFKRMCLDNIALEQQLEQTKAREAQLVAALEFYAKRYPYITIPSSGQKHILIDGGKQAREALNAIH